MIQRSHLAKSLLKLAAALDEAKETLKGENVAQAELCLADAVLEFAYAVQALSRDAGRRAIRLKLHR
jgi:hypothetical protein